MNEKRRPKYSLQSGTVSASEFKSQEPACSGCHRCIQNRKNSQKARYNGVNSIIFRSENTQDNPKSI